MTALKTLLTSLLLACGAAMAGEQAATTVAPADTAAKPAADPVATAASATESTADGTTSATTGPDGTSPLKKQCEAISGSRIRPTMANNCQMASGPMRTYTNEDLQRTGEIDLNEALRKLDPIFR